MSKLSFGAQVIVFAILGAILYGVFYMWFYSPMQQEIKDKTDTHRELQAEVENAQTTGKRLPEFRREVERKEATLQALSRHPSEPERSGRPASEGAAARGRVQPRRSPLQARGYQASSRLP